jgi:hypothetical protein
MEQRLPYDDIDRHGDLMEVYTPCSRFTRRFDFDTFNMGDYQSCENCRHLDHDDRCRADASESRKRTR